MQQNIDDETYLLGLLEQRGLITAEQRQLVILKNKQQQAVFAKQQQGKSGAGKFSSSTEQPGLIEIIVAMNLQLVAESGKFVSEDLIMRAVARDCIMPFKKLDPLELNLDIVTKSIPKSFAINHLLLPFAMSDGVLEVAICDPVKLAVIEEIERANQIKIKPYISTKSEIRKMLAEFYGFQSSISAAESHLARPQVDLGNLEQYVRISSTKEIASSDQNIKAAVDHLFNYAFEQRASDIHIEPKREASIVRLRIDGILHIIYKLPKAVHSAIVSRLKTMSRLDIAEKRRPQDGRIKVDREGKEAEIRVSTIPVAFGEKVVLRILDPDILFQDVAKIGLSERDLLVYRQFMTSPHGIVLVTGPTGSGKSTTLYSTLKQIATPAINVVTVEDPVEMVHEEFNQISVQPQVDVTFASILRNILRQDPDVIMIGEIRDLDTATNAIQAALTGHLVFSTLHTNDAVSSVSRLIDLGVQPFLIGSTMLGAMAQRLVRTICPHCLEKYVRNADELHDSGLPVTETGEITLSRGKGCRHCRNTGFLGRCGIFEIFPMSNRLSRLVVALEAESEIRRIAREEGMTTLKEDAWKKVKSGITTFEEALRVTGSS
ncbi:MAG: type II secretion system protein E [Deltaproteobacteria bacterium RIFOXYD12_FULL_50_9]|nr:MAG: type II secretion system protein E [Deltaproteobacteria bacterium RIFOXYD12_FULL_50_9]